MSLFGGIKKAFKKIAAPVLGGIGTAIGGPVGGLLGTTIGKALDPAYTIKNPGLVYPTMPGAGYVGTNGNQFADLLKTFDPTSAGSFADRVTPDFLIAPKRKPRRMNPMNVRAARRAIRRIKAVRKITHEIERALPKARARSAPPRHSHSVRGRAA